MSNEKSVQPDQEGLIIRVDRSVRPSYPSLVKTVMNPELESSGPTHYTVSEIKQWTHEGQVGSNGIAGITIYEHLKKTDTLKSCLNYSDLKEIQKKGLTFFNTHFKGKAVFAWASVVLDKNGNFRVPGLYENQNELQLYFDFLVNEFFTQNPALQYPSVIKP